MGPQEAVQTQRRRIIDIYATGDLSRDAYVEKCRELDALTETLRAKGKELADNTALLRKREAIEAGIAQYCEAARARFAKCADFASTRQFISDYVEKVVFANDKVALHGQVPIQHTQGNNIETSMLPFRIESKITKEERKRERMRAAESISYQQSIASISTPFAEVRSTSRLRELDNQDPCHNG
jgi:hypothetical protein